jgi:hypothetical protein
MRLGAQSSVILAAVSVLAPLRVLAQGCAMCQTALNGPGDPLSQGINASIYFLMSMPFVLAGGVGTWLFYMHRARARQAEWGGLDTQREGGR